MKQKIHNLQAKQNDLHNKFSDLDTNIETLTKDHEKSSSQMDIKLQSHTKSLNEFEVREEKINADLKEQLQIINKDMKISFDQLKAEIEVTETKINKTIKQNVVAGNEKNDHVLGQFKLIHEKMDEHSEKHKGKREELIKTTKRIDDLIESTTNRFHASQKCQLSNDNIHVSMKDMINNYYQHCEDTTKSFKQKMSYIEKELKENSLEHESFAQVIKETDSKLRKFIEETESKLEEIKKSIILFEKSHHKLSTLVNECNESNRKTAESHSAARAVVTK